MQVSQFADFVLFRFAVYSKPFAFISRHIARFVVCSFLCKTCNIIRFIVTWPKILGGTGEISFSFVANGKEMSLRTFVVMAERLGRCFNVCA